MFNMLARMGINTQIENFCMNYTKMQVSVVKIQDKVKGAKINKGVRQGCTLSPIIFNVDIQEAIDKIKEDTNLGININGQKISMLRFTDDIALFAENKENLDQIIKTMDEIFIRDLCIKITVYKAKVLF